MDYIKTLPLPPPRCRSAPHQLPPASAVCSYLDLRRHFLGNTGLEPAVFPLHSQLFQVKGHVQEEQLRADIGPSAGEKPAETKIIFQQGKGAPPGWSGKGADGSPWEMQCAGWFPRVCLKKSFGDTTLWAVPGPWPGNTGCSRDNRYNSHTGTRWCRQTGRSVFPYIPGGAGASCPRYR